VDEWDRAHFDGHTTTVAVEHDDLGIGDRLVGDDLPCERLARAASLLWDNDRAELAAENVADEALAGRIHPADHAMCVDDVARDVDALERVLDPHRFQH
jgi:hypothetical protein